MPEEATCHAGLQYVWGRIKVQGKFVAATHAGQFRAAETDGDRWPARLAELARVTGISQQELRQAAENVPVLEAAQRQQVRRLLQRVAATFSEIGEERLALLGRLQRIAEMSSYP
jgi:ligand-binding sensor protein